MSAVFLARDPFLSRLVAVKVLHPDLLFQKAVLDRFFKEAKTVSRIQSPNVVNIFDFGVEGNTPYLVMEFIDGQTLQKVVNQLQGEPMDPVVACAMMAQVVEGLKAASEWGVVHRDLKPENLMLSQKGNLKITDFGICHLKGHTMTVTGQMLGSPRFMSPEQVDGIKPLSIQSDLFSLGGVFYYLLTGVPPFIGDSLPDLYRQILFEPHPTLSEVRPGIDRSLTQLVDMLLEKDPTKRGAGPGAISIQLKKYLLKKKVIAPADRIGEYVQELNAKGFQTTSSLNREQVREWMGSLDLGSKPASNSKRWNLGKTALSLLALGLGTGFVYFYSKNGHQELPALESLTPEPWATSFPVQPDPVPSKLEAQQPNPSISNPNPEHASILTDSKDAISEIETPISDIPDSIIATGSAVVTIQSVPPFADVFVDGSLLGRTPLENKPFPAGKYRISLRPKFGAGVDTLVQIKPGIQFFKFVLMENPVSEGLN